MSTSPTTTIPAWSFSCCHAEAKQTTPSKVIRPTALVLGIIAALIAVLILCKIPLLAQANPIVAYVVFPAGVVAVLLAALVKRIHKPVTPKEPPKIEPPKIEPPKIEPPKIEQPSSVLNQVRSITEALPNGIRLSVHGASMSLEKGNAFWGIVTNNSEYTSTLADTLGASQIWVNNLMQHPNLEAASTQLGESLAKEVPKDIIGAWFFVSGEQIRAGVFGDARLVTLDDEKDSSLITLQLYSLNEFNERQEQFDKSNIMLPNAFHSRSFGSHIKLKLVDLHGAGIECRVKRIEPSITMKPEITFKRVGERGIIAEKNGAYCAIMLQKEEHIETVLSHLESNQGLTSFLMTTPKEKSIKAAAGAFGKALQKTLPPEAIGSWCCYRDKMLYIEVLGAAVLVVEENRSDQEKWTCYKLYSRLEYSQFAGNHRILGDEMNIIPTPLHTRIHLALSDGQGMEFYAGGKP